MSRITALMGFEAATLVVAASIHLAGGAPRVGIPEALIAIVLAGGVRALSRRRVQGRQRALAAVAFAVFGFLVGLGFTAGGGSPVNLAYHLVMLPLLVATYVLLLRRPRIG